METAIPAILVKEEFDRSTERFHVITIWVGIVLNLIWFVSDIIVVQEFAGPFFAFRAGVAVTSMVAVVFRRQLHLSIYYCMFILVLGISVQNAFMWSLMSVEQFQNHAFAYMVLFVGVGMLVLWELKLSLLLAALTITANLVFYLLNSRLSPGEFFINGGLLTMTVAVFCVFMIRNRYKLTYNEISSRLALEHSKKIIEQKHGEVLQQKVEIQQKNDDLQHKNKEITDSISYARNIQSALIPTESKFNGHFSDSFVLFRPKDIVSGDFFWVQEKNNQVFYVTADCTGHGVPGGFMTMLGLSFLDEIISVQGVSAPADVLNQMRDRIITTLNRSGIAGEYKDGMDIVVCRLDTSTLALTYASANNNLYLVSADPEHPEQKKFTEYKGDRQPCGYAQNSQPFKQHTLQLREGDCLYTFTDGYADQFGGDRGKKFRYRQFEDLLLKNSHLPFAAQKLRLDEAFEQWKGDLEQVDDILVIGIKISGGRISK